MALVYSPHTTCAIVINELESGFIDDFNEFLAELAPAGRPLLPARRPRRSARRGSRTTPRTSRTATRMSAPGMLSSSSQTIPIVDGALLLGRGNASSSASSTARATRKVFIQVIGE